jgi:hypothetical protein
MKPTEAAAEAANEHRVKIQNSNILNAPIEHAEGPSGNVFYSGYGGGFDAAVLMLALAGALTMLVSEVLTPAPVLMDSMPTLPSVASMRKRRNKSLPGPHGCGCDARVGRRGTKNSV